MTPRRTDRTTFHAGYIFSIAKACLLYQWVGHTAWGLACLLTITLIELYILEQIARPSSASPHCFVDQAKSNQQRRPTLVCLGDSITHGNTSFDWVPSILRSLSQRLAQTPTNDSIWSSSNALWVVNNGQNSITTYTTLSERVDWTLACQPDFVVLLIGTNDARALVETPWRWYEQACWGLMTNGITLEGIEANLRGILEKLNDNCHVAICTIPPYTEVLTEDQQCGVNQVNAAIRRVAAAAAAQNDVTLLDLNAALKSRILNNRSSSSSSSTWTAPHAVWQGFGQHVLGWGADQMSRWIGNTVLTDNIHLNETGGTILSNLVVDWLMQHKEQLQQ